MNKPTPQSLPGLGQASPHESAAAHVTGTARYIDDFPLPADALHVATGYAPATTGTLQHLNLEAVHAASGVVDVVTAQDVPGELDIAPIFDGDPLLCDGTIRFHGQPVFAVAASTERAALQAVQAAQYEIDEVPAHTLLDDARERNTTVLPTRLWGDRSSNKTSNATRRLQREYQMGGQEHFYLEGQAAVAIPGEGGAVEVLSSTQHPDEVQHLVAKVLGLADHQVTVTCPRMGGGFGGKESQAATAACLSALFAQRTGRTVKYRLPRRDDMVQTGKRHPFAWACDLGVDEDGLLTDGHITVTGLCGFSADLSGGIVERAGLHASNAYAIPQLSVDAIHLQTDTVSNTAFRGFGGPQGLLGMEAAMDDLAELTGLSPLDIRLRNLYREGANTTHYGQSVDQLILHDMMTQLAKDSDFEARRAAIEAFNQETTGYLRRGIALTPVQFGISFTVTHLNQAGALVHIYKDGSVAVNHGGTEMGQGLHTKIRQVAAAELGVPVDQVRITHTTTDKVPNASPTAASSGSDLNGLAVLNACRILKTRLAQHFQQAEGSSELVTFNNGQVTCGSANTTFAELTHSAWMARVSLSSTGFYRTPGLHFDKESGQGRPFYYFACGAAVTEVEVDGRTGAYTFPRTDILHDVGTSLNPAIDRGQVEGGYLQGLGWLTSEDLVWAQDGRLLSNSPANYKIPTADMCPAELNVSFYNQPNIEETVYRSKAVGEPPLMLAVSAWCALRQACKGFGNKLPNLGAPATPEAVFWAIQEAKGDA